MKALTNKVVDSAPKKRGPIGPASPYTIVEESEVVAEFGVDRRRESPYRLAIQELMKGAEGKVLRFDKIGARNQIGQQAKKLGVKVLFAEQGTYLYVKLIGSGATNAILAFIRQAPRTKAQIVTHLSGLGMGDVVVDRELQSLSGNGYIRLNTANGNWVATSKGDSEAVPAEVRR